MDKEKELRNYGILGRFDGEDVEAPENFGITDKIINSLINNLMKNLDKQFREMDRSIAREIERTEIKSFPNGVKIKIGYPATEKQRPKTNSILKKQLTPEQIQKMSSLPRAIAKSSMKRLSDSITYELMTPGVESVQDVFISKLEEGYEIKAIGSKKVYVNSLPLNLPLKKLSLLDNKLLVEFKTEE